MQEFKVPELGENVEQGDVTRVLVKVGDTLVRDQPVMELETDKATIEVPSSVAGIVKDIRVKQGDKVKVGAVILTVEEDGHGSAQPVAESGKPQVAVVEAEKAEASRAEPGKVEAVASEPARTEFNRTEPAKTEPAKAEQKVLSMPRPARAAEPEPRVPSPERVGPAAPASPSVRRLAREIGVDINDVHGTGSAGRISPEDVKEHARRILSSVGANLARGTGQAPSQAPLPDFEKFGPVERQQMTGIRRKTAEHLSHAWRSIPHVTQFDKADITAMEELRGRFRKQVEEAGGNLTVTAVLVKVLAAAVKEFPQFNASLDVEANAIVYKKYVNVGIAVDTEYGLLVPVIRHADQKNITQIAVEMNQLSEKARAKKLTLDEMSGGGISISNLGGIGGTYFTPIVNWPEVAILGVSRGIVEPVFVRESIGSSSTQASKGLAGRFEPRQLLPLSLSYDHRVIDGADAMRFLRWVVAAIEQPFLLSLLG